MTLVIRDHAIGYQIDGEMLGLMTWVEEPELYIHFLGADRPEALAPMFAAFRRKYPDTLVFFDVAEDNERMRRFIKLVGAQKDPDGRYFVKPRNSRNAS